MFKWQKFNLAIVNSCDKKMTKEWFKLAYCISLWLFSCCYWWPLCLVTHIARKINLHYYYYYYNKYGCLSSVWRIKLYPYHHFIGVNTAPYMKMHFTVSAINIVNKLARAQGVSLSWTVIIQQSRAMMIITFVWYEPLLVCTQKWKDLRNMGCAYPFRRVAL